MEIEVGEWIRSKDGYIGKVKKITYDNMEKCNYYICEKDNVMASNYLENIAKHSKNIIDLVEVGDYVNGNKVISVDYDVIDNKTECIELDLNNNYQYNFISARQIKTIITKEQMQSIEYKLEEE